MALRFQGTDHYHWTGFQCRVSIEILSQDFEEALGWEGMLPLPTDVYSNLVRFFYCNLEICNLDNIEFTRDTKVKGKDIVLNPTILSEITGIPNSRECIFINKPNQLEKYVQRKTMNEVISTKER